MIFTTTIHGTPCYCHVMGSTAKKLYYRLLDQNRRPALWLKCLQTPETEQQLLQEYRATSHTEYYVAP